MRHASWAEAKNTRASYQCLKTDKLLELEIILQSIQQTEDALGDADHFIGELYYLIKKSGLKPPQMSDEVEDTSYTHTIQSDDDRFSSYFRQWNAPDTIVYAANGIPINPVLHYWHLQGVSRDRNLGFRHKEWRASSKPLKSTKPPTSVLPYFYILDLSAKSLRIFYTA
ncbi:hypothetical protein CPB83DRAFT_841115 [Crepidotus variabilis]|uniref:Uncharacterized protein n=1 Tax=Crepidotus variabilis TaxID=179855 RepID=A0A9P6JHN4_9AGAR|nr:hypothetical protein CPB83DRAFT_841115 [Crepidotus variabilis]